MSFDQLLQHLLEQVEGSHYSFIRFVGRINRHEWDWAPDDGIQCARDVAASLVREEVRILAKHGGEHAASVDRASLGTPNGATAALRGLREATLSALRRELPATNDDRARHVMQAAVSLAQLDAHALGEMVLLQRLIDPSRATVSPR